MNFFLKKSNKKKLQKSLIIFCYISFPFFLKKKIILTLILIEGFFEIYIFGYINKLNKYSYILSRMEDVIWYKFTYINPFLFVYLYF